MNEGSDKYFYIIQQPFEDSCITVYRNIKPLAVKASTLKKKFKKTHGKGAIEYREINQ